VLSLIGKEYESAESILIVLTLAIIPMSITVNLISKLNNLNKSKTLIITGFIQLATFFICFFITVPLYGTMGAAISILVTYIVSSIFLVIISDRNSLRWISSACFSIFAGFATNYVLGAIMGYQNELVVTAFSVTVSILAIFLSKCMTKEETSLLLKEIIRRS